MERLALRKPRRRAARRHRRVHGLRQVIPHAHDLQCDPRGKTRRRHRAVRDAMQRAASFRQARPLPRGLVPLADSVCRFPPVYGQGMSVAAQECCVLASLLESRQGHRDPLDGLAEAFLAEIQPLLETPWAVAMADLVYPQTRGERRPDYEKKLQYAHALMRLTGEDAEADKILAEVRSLLKPASALREPELASKVMAMMEPA